MNLQTPEKIFEQQFDNGMIRGNIFTFKKDYRTLYSVIKKSMEEAQKQAVQYTLKMAAEKAQVCRDLGEDMEGFQKYEIEDVYYDQGDYPVYIHESSILSLESQILKDLGNETTNVKN